MPRFAKIENISIKEGQSGQSGTDSTESKTLNQIILSATVSFNIYYDNTAY
jgi:hypothetical protein